MFADLIAWYTDRAALIFAVLVASAIAIELGCRRLAGRLDRGDGRSLVTSLTSGLAFLGAKTVVGKLAATALALYVYERYRLTTLDLRDPRVWIAVLVARDFAYYWMHRAEHRVRLLWAAHMVHHSPTTIGFDTAIRVPWMEAVYKPWFSLWLPLLGFHPVAAIALDVAAATMAQLYHTERVGRMPIVEWVFVTPSSHRVHHGSNPEYIDKNFGAVFIVWDRLFGTFEPEVVPVRYGIGATSVDTPTEALVGGYPSLFGDVRSIEGWSHRLRHAIGPPTG